MRTTVIEWIQLLMNENNSDWMKTTVTERRQLLLSEDNCYLNIKTTLLEEDKFSGMKTTVDG